jgi:hypothetical protein
MSSIGVLGCANVSGNAAEARRFFMVKMIAVSLLLLLPAAKERAWQEGTLADVTDHSSTTKITGPNIITGEQEVRSTVWYEYTIQTGERFYVARYAPALRWGGFGPQKSPMDLDINAKVTFAIEKQLLYLKDKDGKEYKLGIVKQGLRQAEGSKP